MAEKINFNIDLAGLKDFVPYEGLGTSSLLKQDGYYQTTINKIVLGKSSTGNPKYIVSMTVTDADEKGQTLLADVLVGGLDKNGNSNIRRLGDFLLSVGMGVEAIRALAGNGQVPGEALAQQLLGKLAHVEVEAETYNGNTTSRVRNFIPPSRYSDAVAANAHRKPRRGDQPIVTGVPGAQAPVATASTAPATMNLGLGTPAAAPAVPALDPAARLKGLGLV